MEKRIILASKSPARRELMKKLGITFECTMSNYHENMASRENPIELAQFLAREKARKIAKKFPNAIIIGADTFCVLGKEKIGKPTSIQEARTMIQSYNKAIVDVHTGLAIIETDKIGKIIRERTKDTISTIIFGAITPENVEEIIAHDNVLHLGGALSIEGFGGKFIEKIEGSYDNIIGLPVEELQKMLTDSFS